MSWWPLPTLWKLIHLLLPCLCFWWLFFFSYWRGSWQSWHCKVEWVTWTLIKTVSPKASQRMLEHCKKCVCIGDGNVLKSYRFLYYFYLFILFANCFMSLNIPLYVPPVSEWLPVVYKHSYVCTPDCTCLFRTILGRIFLNHVTVCNWPIVEGTNMQKQMTSVCNNSLLMFWNHKKCQFFSSNN
jgi:hypothetical protein